jgi:hypothetical protein
MINPSLLLVVGTLLGAGGLLASIWWPTAAVAIPVGVIALIFAITEN